MWYLLVCLHAWNYMYEMKLHCYKKWWKERNSMTFWWLLNCDKTLDRSLLMIIRAFIQCSITADFCCFGLWTGGWITSWSPRDSRRTCVTALSNRRSWAATTVQSCYWWRGSSKEALHRGTRRGNYLTSEG